MNYEEAMEAIRSRKSSGISMGLSRMEALCRFLDNPERKLRVIHIAGTNGKGSVAAYISSILGVSGYLVGRYVSPAVICQEEFIQFEDSRGVSYIDKELLTESVAEVDAAARRMEAEGIEPPTSFEFETAAAFVAFVKKGCQIVIVEAGLGGREDATNVIQNPIACVITSISRDHMKVLGDTIEEIAAEKAGIIKENTTVIACPDALQAENVLIEKCKEKKAVLTLLHKEDMELIRTDLEGCLFSYRGDHYQTAMAGSYQMENACLAIETCCHLGEEFQLDTVKRMLGIREAYWRGRFDVVSRKPLVIVDGAHNERGAGGLRETLETLLPDARIHGIMGVFRDKEYEKMISIMRPVIYDIVTVTPPSPRGLPAEELQAAWRRQGCSLVETAESAKKGHLCALDSALKMMLERYEEGDAIVIFGSLSLLGELKWR